MFSGIQSLLFGKKHHHKHDDSTDDKSQESTDDFVTLERRHSDDDQNALYPNLDPSKPLSSNLPYAISPSLPNLKDATSDSVSTKEEPRVDMLQGVPFVLSAQLLLLEENKNPDLKKIKKCLEEFKESGEAGLSENYNYDFELEHSVFSEYE